MLQLFDCQALGFDGLLHHLQFGALRLNGIDHLPQYFLQQNRVCGKAIKVEPHAADYSRSSGSILHKTAVFRQFIAHARVGVTTSSWMIACRQSSPSTSIANCAAESRAAAPSCARGHTNFPRSRRLA